MLTSDELKKALRGKTPLICQDRHGTIEYERATAIIYKLDEDTGNIVITVRLKDKNGNTYVEAKASDLTLKENRDAR